MKRQGKPLIEAEYVRRVQALLERCAAEGIPAEKAAELEFELTVRFKLGEDFPPERTAALWQIRQAFNQKRDRIGRATAGPLSALLCNFRLFILVRKMRKAFLSVLSPEEARTLLGD